MLVGLLRAVSVPEATLRYNCIGADFCRSSLSFSYPFFSLLFRLSILPFALFELSFLLHVSTFLEPPFPSVPVSYISGTSFLYP